MSMLLFQACSNVNPFAQFEATPVPLFGDVRGSIGLCTLLPSTLPSPPGKGWGSNKSNESKTRMNNSGCVLSPTFLVTKT